MAVQSNNWNNWNIGSDDYLSNVDSWRETQLEDGFQKYLSQSLKIFVWKFKNICQEIKNNLSKVDSRRETQLEDGFLGSAGMSDWRRVTNSFTKHAASPNKDKKPSRGAEIHKWAERWTILERRSSPMFWSMTSSHCPPAWTTLVLHFAMLINFHLGRCSLVMDWRTSASNFSKVIFIKMAAQNVRQTKVYMRCQSRAWIYSVTDTICLWMFEDQINVHLDSLPGCPGLVIDHWS